MTDEELRRLCERCHRGPWWVERPDGRDAYIACGTRGDLSDTYDVYEIYDVDADYELMAAAREAVPRLLAEKAALEARLRQVDVEAHPETVSCSCCDRAAWQKAALQAEIARLRVELKSK